ncbi:MAG: glycosyltransferase family 4 protein [Burkholderiales bacterium]
MLSLHILHLLPPVAALVITWRALAYMRRGRIARTLQDLPNARSLHAQPVPRIGGLGIAAGLAAAAVALPLTGLPVGGAWGALALGYLALVLLSMADDRRPLPVAIRLPVHLGVCAAWLWAAGLPLAWLAPMALGLAWCANLFNFMDGADGLAGSMAVSGFGACAVGGALAGDVTLAVAAASVASAALGFLRFNWPPARLFMGDAGSVPLGFAAGAIGVMGVRQGVWSPAFPLIVFFPFVFDASFTLARRMLTGQRFWMAHREHLFQRLVLGGMSHRALAGRACPLMAACALLALLTRGQPALAWAALAGLCLGGGSLAWAIRRRAAMNRQSG